MDTHIFAGIFVFIMCVTQCHGLTYIETIRERATLSNMTARVLFKDTRILVYYIPDTSDFYIVVEGRLCHLSGSLLEISTAVYQAATHSERKDRMLSVLSDPSGSEQDLYHIKLEVTGSRTIVGMTAVQPSKESSYKFLPFCLEDFPYIFRLIALPRIVNAALSSEILPIKLDVAELCFANTSTNTDPPSTGVTNHVHDLEADTLNLLTTAFFLLISFNPNWKLEERYEICTTTFNVYRDAPFILQRCCSVQQRLIFQVDREEVNIVCHHGDIARVVLGETAITLCLLALLFAPLLIGFVPVEEEARRPATDSGESAEGVCLEDMASGQGRPVDDLGESAGSDHVEVVRVQTQVDADSDDHVESRRQRDAMCTTPPDPDHSMWVYLDTDPVHYLSPSLLAARMLCLHSDRPVVIIVVRFILLYVSWALTGLLAFYTYTFYDSVFFHPLMSLQQRMLRYVFRNTNIDHVTFMSHDSSHNTFYDVLILLVITGPLVLTTLTMFSLYNLLLHPGQIAKKLYWKNHCKVIGVTIPCGYKSRQPSVGCYLSRKHVISPYPALLCSNMLHNLSHLKESGFWLVLWNHFVCRFAPAFRLNDIRAPVSHDGCARPLQAICILVSLPVAVAAFFVHILPIFSVLSNLVLNTKAVIIPKFCQEKNPILGSLVFYITLPFTILGILLLYTLLWIMSVLYGQGFVFLMVDVLRNSDATLSRVIFAISVLVYIRKAFIEFEDQYRLLKAKTFAIAKDMEEKADVKNRKLVLKKEPSTTLLQIKDDIGFELALPKFIFDEICAKVKPHKTFLAKTILKLLASLALILSLFLLAVEFQIFHEFTLIGETFLTILTVSIPRLFGMMQTDGYSTLKEMKQEQEIEAIIASYTTESV